MTADIILFKPNAVPAHLRGVELSETTKALMGSGSSGKRISIKGGVFRLVSGGKELAQIEERHLDVVIARAAPKVGRQFYEAKYDGNATPAAPDCWSNDGEKPDPTSRKMQNPTCNGCKQNIAGSGQGESRACRYQQRLAVMLPDDMDGGAYQLALPATSLFGKEDGDKRPLQAYARYLAMQTPPVDVGMLVTRMKFDTRSESPKLFFSAVRWLTPEEYARAKEVGESPEAVAAVTMTVAQTDGVATSRPAPIAIEGARPDPVDVDPPETPAKPEKTARVSKAKAAPETPAPEADEPEKRADKPKADAAVPRTAGNLASIVSQWDDE